VFKGSIKTAVATLPVPCMVRSWLHRCCTLGKSNSASSFDQFWCVTGAQTFTGLTTRLTQFSPLSFIDKKLERDFLATKQSYGVQVTTWHFVALLGFACVSHFFNPTSEIERAARSLGMGAVLALSVRAMYPSTFQKHLQVLPVDPVKVDSPRIIKSFHT
jgi:hypothetical protein